MPDKQHTVNVGIVLILYIRGLPDVVGTDLTNLF